MAQISTVGGSDGSLVKSALVALGTLFIVYSIGTAVYNVYFHPLAGYPGPKSRAAFLFIEAWARLRGTSFSQTKQLHDEYGSVVRVAPNTLSYISAQAWQDIYALRKDRTEIARDTTYYRSGPALLAANQQEHYRLRKLLAPGFTDGALLEQESLLTVYFNLLIDQLKDKVDKSRKGSLDMAAWYNFTTFDIIGDLVMGEPFGAVQSGEYHFWMRAIFDLIKLLGVLRFAMTYPIFGVILQGIRSIPIFSGKGKKFLGFTKKRFDARVEQGTDRKDIMTHFLRHQAKSDLQPLSYDEIFSTAVLLLVAGSETSATHLSGATWFLLNNAHALKRAQAEVRAAFSDPSEITLKTLSDQDRLPYLNAVIQEVLRLYPSVPVLIPRITRPEGDMIDGRFVPGNVLVGAHPWSAFHCRANFAAPDEFHPERWLPDERPDKFKDDNIAAYHPFSLGPKNCPGKGLAHFEIRSILTRVLWYFDLALDPKSRDWMVNQKEYLLWDKAPLWVKLKQRAA